LLITFISLLPDLILLEYSMLPCRISPVTFSVRARERFTISGQCRSTLRALHFRFPTHSLAPLFALKLPLASNRLFLRRMQALLLSFGTPGNELTLYGESPSGEGGFVGLHYMLLPTLGMDHCPTRATENYPTCEKRITTDSTIHGRSPFSFL
jgi:hypothetical protein